MLGLLFANLPDRKSMLFMRFAGVRFGRLNCSRAILAH
jgi:hypothetical protein